MWALRLIVISTVTLHCSFIYLLYFIEMDAFTEESLNKLPKQELAAMYLKVTKKMESLNDHLLEKV